MKESIVSYLVRLQQQGLDLLRHRLAELDALALMTLLGLISGLLSGAIIIAFRFAIELPISAIQANIDNINRPPAILCFTFPIIGALLLAAIARRIKPSRLRVGVPFVIDRLNNHQGHLPLGNGLWQFFGGAITIISGQSLGREGPAAHMGATAASLLGRWISLPNNSMRLLVACGVASAISASFNTPVSGVIFAMEVVLMEYSITGFVPVIMASVTGATLAQMYFGNELIIEAKNIEMEPLDQIPMLMVAGFAVATVAMLMMRLQLAIANYKGSNLTKRFFYAGLLTGCLAIFWPQILGIGYHSIQQAIDGQMSLQLVLCLLLVKVLASSVSAGVGLPGGIIGPSLFVGAMLGASMGHFAQLAYPDAGNLVSDYVQICMAAMFAVVVNAPLAALMTIFELTFNPHIIFPAMLVIVVSMVVTQWKFPHQGLFNAQLELSGLRTRHGPISQAMSRTGVRKIMNGDFVETEAQQKLSQLESILNNKKPTWLLVVNEENSLLISAADIATHLSRKSGQLSEEESLNLCDLPGRKLQLQAIGEQASVYEAAQKLRRNQIDGLYVQRRNTKFAKRTIGIVTAHEIENYYDF